MSAPMGVYATGRSYGFKLLFWQTFKDLAWLEESKHKNTGCPAWEHWLGRDVLHLCLQPH